MSVCPRATVSVCSYPCWFLLRFVPIHLQSYAFIPKRAREAKEKIWKESAKGQIGRFCYPTGEILLSNRTFSLKIRLERGHKQRLAEPPGTAQEDIVAQMDHVPDVFRLVHIEVIPIDDLLKCLYAHGQPLQFVLIHAGFFCVSCLFTCKATLLFRNGQGMQRKKKGKNRRRGKQAVFATQLGSKFFPVGASIQSISLAADFRFIQNME